MKQISPHFLHNKSYLHNPLQKLLCLHSPAKLFFIRAKHKPLTLFTDSLQAYRKAYRKVWGSKTRREDKETYIRLKANKDKRNNIVERIQGTIRERIKVIRGFKNKESAESMLNLFLVWYNFIRVHQGINMTPAQKANINLALNQNKWLDLIYLSKAFKVQDIRGENNE